jgi:dUTP pyrophosphatase
MNFFSILAPLQLKVESFSSMVGEFKKIIKTKQMVMTKDTGRDKLALIGNIRAKTLTKSKIGRIRLAALGNTRSRKIITNLDYALTMTETVPVLIVADPELMPAYAQPGDAGCDLRASEALTVPARGRILVKTGVSIALPDGYVGLVHPRSGLAAKHGITVLNTPGTIDAGYRGEVMVTLYNSSDQDFEVARLDRIAQLVIQQVSRAHFVVVDHLPESSRGEAGFGSSGVK